MFYDLCIRSGNVNDILPFAKKLGWEGVGIISDSGKFNEMEKTIKSTNNKGIGICLGIEIHARATHIKKEVMKYRKRAEIIVVKGGDLETNRKAVSIPEVDLLSHPWGLPESTRSDSGINHISAKIAKENNVGVCFEFRDMLHSQKKTRSSIFKNMLEAARIMRKYNSPFLISSGAVSRWDLRAPSELISFGKVLGFDIKEIKHYLDGHQIRENRKRLGGKWIMPGVEIK